MKMIPALASLCLSLSGACLPGTSASPIALVIREDSTTRLDFDLEWSAASDGFGVFPGIGALPHPPGSLIFTDSWFWAEELSDTVIRVRYNGYHVDLVAVATAFTVRFGAPGERTFEHMAGEGFIGSQVLAVEGNAHAARFVFGAPVAAPDAGGSAALLLLALGGMLLHRRQSAS